MINQLTDAEFLKIMDTEAMTLSSAVYARVMSRYCLKFATVKAMKDLSKGTTTPK